MAEADNWCWNYYGSLDNSYFLTKPADEETLLKFYRLIKPGGPGWEKFLEKIKKDGKEVKEIGRSTWDVPTNLMSVFLGCISVYSALFATGFWIYSEYSFAMIATITAIISTIFLIKRWTKLKI